MDEINRKALVALEKGEFDVAQQLLRINLKNNPSHLSYNNLGFFYVDNGMTLEDGRCINASKIGMRYLKKASELDVSYKNCMAIGMMSRFDNAYKIMEKAFEKALSCKEDYAAYYNLGSTYIKENTIEKAVDAFIKAFEFAKNENDRYATALALLHLSQKNKKIDSNIYLKYLDYAGEEKRIDDEVAVLYFMGRQDLIISNYIEAIEEEYCEMPVIAMIVDAFLVAGKQTALDKYIEKAEELYEDEDISIIKDMVIKEALRKKYVSTYEYKYGFEDRVCCYIECPVHD